MDGGSTDNTIDILKKFDSSIKWISEKDKGQTHAINKGMELVSGEILGFLNSDDYLLPNTLKIIAENFDDEDILWLTGDYVIVDTNEKLIQSFVVRYKRFLRKISSKNLLLITNYIIQPSTFWRKSLSEQIGLFDESLKFVMDYDYWLRAFDISKPKIIDEPLSAFRIHKNSKGGSEFIRQFQEEYLVSQKYTHNKLIRLLHKIHNELIVFVYRLIK